MKRIVNEYYQYNQRFLTTILNYETLIEKVKFYIMVRINMGTREKLIIYT